MTGLDDSEPSDDYGRLVQRLRQFAAERDWEQFHTPKNLAMALAGEVGELVAELQWLSDAEIAAGLNGSELRKRVENEAADVLIYLVRFADQAGIDLFQAAGTKISNNAVRYPVERARGSAAKSRES